VHHIGTGGDRPTMKSIDVVDTKVRDVAVIADLRGRGCIWTATQHECCVAGSAESPVPGFDVIEFAAENVSIPRPGELEVMNGQHRI
jgi:hypothetical protein